MDTPKKPKRDRLSSRHLDARRLVREAKANKNPEPVPTHDRPRTRGECANMPRPCPFVGCKYHLFLEVTRTGAIHLPWGEDPAAIANLPYSCALDVAELEEMGRIEIAKLFNVVPFSITNAYQSALSKMGQDFALEDYAPPDAKPLHNKARPGYRCNSRKFQLARHAAGGFAAEPPHA